MRRRLSIAGGHEAGAISWRWDAHEEYRTLSGSGPQITPAQTCMLRLEMHGLESWRSWLRLRVSIQGLPWDRPFSANRPVTLSEICIGGLNKRSRHFSCWGAGKRRCASPMW